MNRLGRDTLAAPSGLRALASNCLDGRADGLGFDEPGLVDVRSCRCAVMYLFAYVTVRFDGLFRFFGIGTAKTSSGLFVKDFGWTFLGSAGVEMNLRV